VRKKRSAGATGFRQTGAAAGANRPLSTATECLPPAAGIDLVEKLNIAQRGPIIYVLRLNFYHRVAEAQSDKLGYFPDRWENNPF
jgi:hypothetical protein